jgi:hypothetical protein
MVNKTSIEVGDIVQIIDKADSNFRALYIVREINDDDCWVYTPFEGNVYWTRIKYEKFTKVGKSLEELVIRSE